MMKWVLGLLYAGPAQISASPDTAPASTAGTALAGVFQINDARLPASMRAQIQDAQVAVYWLAFEGPEIVLLAQDGSLLDICPRTDLMPALPPASGWTQWLRRCADALDTLLQKLPC